MSMHVTDNPTGNGDTNAARSSGFAVMPDPMCGARSPWWGYCEERAGARHYRRGSTLVHRIFHYEPDGDDGYELAGADEWTALTYWPQRLRHWWWRLMLPIRNRRVQRANEAYLDTHDALHEETEIPF